MDMAGFRDKDKALFPIKNINSVIQLFKNQLENTCEPDLALLSIVAGVIENSLTSRCNAALQIYEPVEQDNNLPFLELESIETLYNKFYDIMKNTVELNKLKTFATRDLIKKVSDVIWNSLTRSYYKDRAHLQSLYSYLTGSKLDCFGVAFAVVAGCQVLGYNDVHLALSEDHAWVVFGQNGTDTAEVTWHGKGNEDKRGQEISKGISAKSWLYVNNEPVICTRHMEVAALVSAINPSLNPTHDAFELSLLQQELLWLLYDLGHLRKYPMAIGNLGDLEEISPTEGRLSCKLLFEEAITSARTYYKNQHVYPYTYQGAYFYRNKLYKEAFESWANASDVIRLYYYSRDDEEIYKEFFEIANELIPHIIKTESAEYNTRENCVLKNPGCFANLLRFYDGICQWEEGSATPVLHIGWAKPLVNTISKFDSDIRTQINIVCDKLELPKNTDNSFNNNNYEKKNDTEIINNSLTSNISNEGDQPCHPTIEALTAACSEKILNPEYLLQGDGSPFVGGDTSLEAKKVSGKNTPHLHTDKEDNKHNSPREETESKLKIVSDELQNKNASTSKDYIERKSGNQDEVVTENRTMVILHSQKMRQLQSLLLAEKLNTHAISLHLTAQSQVQIGKKGRCDIDQHIRPKRVRRE